MSILLNIFAIPRYFNKKNVGILIKFTIIADQMHDIFINVTGNQHKNHIFLSLDEVHKTKNYINEHSDIEIKSVALAQTSCTNNYSVL